MAPTFSLSFVFFNRFENQNMFWKQNSEIYLFSLVFQNGGNNQDGVFQIFYAFLQALEFLIVNY
jgi:hypothetical protein